MLLLDGHNLIGRLPGHSLEREEEGREAVLRLVGAAKGGGGERVTVVFDGDRPGSAKSSGFGGLTVVYSPAGKNADDEIVRRLGGVNPKSVTVVTSDIGLAARVRAEGARVMRCEEFLSRLSEPKSRHGIEEKPEPSSTEVEDWLAEFEKRRS